MFIITTLEFLGPCRHHEVYSKLLKNNLNAWWQTFFKRATRFLTLMLSHEASLKDFPITGDRHHLQVTTGTWDNPDILTHQILHLN